MTLVKCDECGNEVSSMAASCPRCGYPVATGGTIPFWMRTGIWGYEWKSETTILGLPLVHIAIGWDMNKGRLLVAKGIIAVGQFAFGFFTIAQFGIGLVFGLGQFIAGTFAIGQFALGLLFAFGQFAAGYHAFGQFAYGKYMHSLIDL